MRRGQVAMLDGWRVVSAVDRRRDSGAGPGDLLWMIAGSAVPTPAVAWTGGQGRAMAAVSTPAVARSVAIRMSKTVGGHAAPRHICRHGPSKVHNMPGVPVEGLKAEWWISTDYSDYTDVVEKLFALSCQP